MFPFPSAPIPWLSEGTVHLRHCQLKSEEPQPPPGAHHPPQLECLGFRQQKAGLQMASAARENLLKLTASHSSAQAAQGCYEPLLHCPWPLGAHPPSVGIFTTQKKKALRGPGCTAATCHLIPRRMSPAPKEQARGSPAHGDLAKRGRAASIRSDGHPATGGAGQGRPCSGQTSVRPSVI